MLRLIFNYTSALACALVHNTNTVLFLRTRCPIITVSEILLSITSKLSYFSKIEASCTNSAKYSAWAFALKFFELQNQSINNRDSDESHHPVKNYSPHRLVWVLTSRVWHCDSTSLFLNEVARLSGCINSQIEFSK